MSTRLRLPRSGRDVDVTNNPLFDAPDVLENRRGDVPNAPRSTLPALLLGEVTVLVPFRRVCCAVDFSDPSTSAFEMAVALCKRFGSELTLFHVDQLPGYTMPDGPAFATADTLNRHRLALESALSDLATRAKDSGLSSVEMVNQLGDPASEIARYADVGRFDVLVMGTHGYTGLKHAIMGSVAEKVVRKARCPVLVVHPQEFALQPSAP